MPENNIPGDSDLLGHWSANRCPRCYRRTLINDVGDEWCGSKNCFWINDSEEDEEIVRTILDPNKKQ